MSLGITDSLVQALDGTIHHGWRASWEYPGFFEFLHPGRTFRVFVGEDSPGELLVSAHEDDGAAPALASGLVNYEEALTRESFIEKIQWYLVTPPERWEAES